MPEQDLHSRSLIRCEACGTATPAYDIVNYGSIEDGYRQLCSQCLNAEVASTQGLDRFENIRFDQVAMNDCAGVGREAERVHARLWAGRAGGAGQGGPRAPRPARPGEKRGKKKGGGAHAA